MLNIVKRFGAVACYLLLMSIFLGFRPETLFDWKLFLVFALGTGLLLLPSLREKAEGETAAERLRRISFCALWAGSLESFLLCMKVLEQLQSREELFAEMALCLRPVFYGVCIWGVFAQEPGKEAEGDMPAKEQKEGGIREMTVSESYAVFQELGLTRRECEVAILICRGMSNGEIAEDLCISEGTVKKHVSNIFEKLGCGRREQVRKKLFS